jgi:hypothetical protein
MIQPTQLNGKWFEYKTSFSGKEKIRQDAFPIYRFNDDQTLETGMRNGSAEKIYKEEKTWKVETQPALDVTYLKVNEKRWFKFLSLKAGILCLQMVQSGLVIFLTQEISGPLS